MSELFEITHILKDMQKVQTETRGILLQCREDGLRVGDRLDRLEREMRALRDPDAEVAPWREAVRLNGGDSPATGTS